MKKFPSAVVFGVVAGLLLCAVLWHPTLAAAPSPTPADEKGAAQSLDAKEREQKSRDQKETVRLIVDYGDGVTKQFHQIKWQDKMTVQDVTLAAAKHPRGIQIKQQGKKATAFLSQIDDLANNARGQSWVYKVNGKLAGRSFGVYEVKAGDVVTWSYQAYP